MLVRFPHEESGKNRKLSKPWHGLYRIVQKNNPDVTVVSVHFPESGSIQVHQSRVCPCPPKWPTGFYWYGGNKLSRGGVPKWLEKLLSREPTLLENEIMSTESAEDTSQPEEVMATELTQDTGHNEPVSVCDEDGDESLSMLVPNRKLPPDGRYNLRRNIKPPERLVKQAVVWDEHTS